MRKTEYTVLSQKGHVAACEHQCSDCERVIQKGETYLATAIRSFEGFFVDKRCVVCLVKDGIYG